MHNQNNYNHYVFEQWHFLLILLCIYEYELTTDSYTYIAFS